MNNPRSGFIRSIAVAAVAAGIILRILSFHWNDRLQGDVNLVALTAREFVVHNRLYYPMKYEYSDRVAYKVLESPSTQHPILYPFLCGLLGKAFGTDDTFLILKAMCGFAGILLILVIAFWGARSGWGDVTLLAVTYIALSPMLVDFSANGSSYMVSAIIIILAIILMERFRYETVSHYALAGIVSGIGMQNHVTMFCVPAAFIVFWMTDRSRLRGAGVFAFFLFGFLALIPSISWNLFHFGRPFYTYTTINKIEGIYGGVITTRSAKPLLTAAPLYIFYFLRK